MTLGRIAVLLALAGALAGPTPALAASVLPPATYELSVTSSPDVFGVGNASGNLSASQLAVLSLSGATTDSQVVTQAQVSRAGFVPIVQSSIASTEFTKTPATEPRPPRIHNTGTSAKLTYWVMLDQLVLLPPDVSLLGVPVIITSNLHASASATGLGTGSALAGASVQSGPLGLNLGVGASCVGPTCFQVDELIDFVTVALMPLFGPVPITLSATVNAVVNGVVDETGGAGAQAIADPLIEIDPTFAYKDYFALVFSENLFETPSETTPGPAAGALLALGLAGAVAARRRR